MWLQLWRSSKDGDVYCQEQIEAFLFCLAADASPTHSSKTAFVSNVEWPAQARARDHESFTAERGKINK